MIEFLLGFMIAAWLLTLAGVAYALWNWAYQAPKSRINNFRDHLFRELDRVQKEIEETREALTATNQALVNLDNRVGMVQSISRTDEEQAEMERRWKARQNVYNAGGFGKSA